MFLQKEATEKFINTPESIPAENIIDIKNKLEQAESEDTMLRKRMFKSLLMKTKTNIMKMIAPRKQANLTWPQGHFPHSHIHY